MYDPSCRLEGGGSAPGDFFLKQIFFGACHRGFEVFEFGTYRLSRVRLGILGLYPILPGRFRATGTLPLCLFLSVTCHWDITPSATGTLPLSRTGHLVHGGYLFGTQTLKTPCHWDITPMFPCHWDITPRYPGVPRGARICQELPYMPGITEHPAGVEGTMVLGSGRNLFIIFSSGESAPLVRFPSEKVGWWCRLTPPFVARL